MEEVLEGINDVTAYLDDVIYASNTWEEHLQTLDEAFARLAKNKVYLHPLKCEWGVTEIEYLGMKVSHNRISIADDKLAALKAYTPPTDFKGVRRFLGFCQYLAHFIPNYSSKVSSISDMLKGADKKKKFIWTSACQEAFNLMRFLKISLNRKVWVSQTKMGRWF
jgi:cleavage and polyadenylation specificity factor subunit 1